MPKHRIDCYNAASGVVITFTWDEGEDEDYLRSKAFLQDLVGGPIPSSPPDDIEHFYFATDQQRDAFYKFLSGTEKGKRMRALRGYRD